eukprot:c12715_g1_i1 orf=276-572(+)
MFLEVEVAAQGRREWVQREPAPGTPRTCSTWIEQPSPCQPLPQGATWMETPSPRIATSRQFPPASEEKMHASILAMGRATPRNKIDQATYTDWYFNIT